MQKVRLDLQVAGERGTRTVLPEDRAGPRDLVLGVVLKTGGRDMHYWLLVLVGSLIVEPLIFTNI